MGTSWTVHEISVKIFETWSEKQLRMANICLFQMAFSQWRAAQIIFAFSKKLLLQRVLTLCTQNFKVHWPALHVFCNFLSHFMNKHFCIFLPFIIFDFLKTSLLTHSALIAMTCCCPLLYEVLRSLWWQFMMAMSNVMMVHDTWWGNINPPIHTF